MFSLWIRHSSSLILFWQLFPLHPIFCVSATLMVSWSLYIRSFYLLIHVLITLLSQYILLNIRFCQLFNLAFGCLYWFLVLFHIYLLIYVSILLSFESISFMLSFIISSSLQSPYTSVFLDYFQFNIGRVKSGCMEMKYEQLSTCISKNEIRN